jgi:hypothetical protein
MALGGAAAILLAGLLASLERRAGRLLAYAAMLSLGFVLLDLSQGSGEALAYAGLEISFRAVALTGLAVSVAAGHAVQSFWARRLAVVGFVIAGFSLAGLRIGVGMAERWNVLVQLAASGTPIFWLLIVGQFGLLVGILRFALDWLRELEPAALAEAIDAPALVPTEVGLPSIDSQATASSNGRTFSDEAEEDVIEVPEYGTSDEPRSQPEEVVEAAPARLSKRRRELKSQQHRAEARSSRAVGRRAEASDEVQIYGATEIDDGGYQFEAHLRELFAGLSRRGRRVLGRLLAPVRSPLRRLIRSLPLGLVRMLRAAAHSVLLIFRNWRVWASIGLILTILALVLLIGLAPGLVLQRTLASLGQSPFVR